MAISMTFVLKWEELSTPNTASNWSEHPINP